VKVSLELANQRLEVTRQFLWLDSDLTRKNSRWLWLDSDSTLTRLWLDSDSTLTRLWLDSDSTLTRLDSTKSWLGSDSKGSWLWLDKNDSGTSLIFRKAYQKIYFVCLCQVWHFLTNMSSNLQINVDYKLLLWIFLFCDCSKFKYLFLTEHIYYSFRRCSIKHCFGNFVTICVYTV